jgi:hypothetical protein
MGGERKAIESPLCVDFTDRPVPPLKFVLQAEYSPAGVVERSEGMIAGHSPWYGEFALELTGLDAVTVLYVMSKDDDTALLMACLDTSMEPFFGFVSGADFGDDLTQLTALHWPDVYGMLLASNRRTPGARIICTVATPGCVQWVVADQIPVAQAEDIPKDRILDLLRVALQTFVRTSQFYLELPGVIEVLGGPDRTSRRLKAAAGLFRATGDITGVFDSGIGADEVVKLAKSARSFVESLVALKD